MERRFFTRKQKTVMRLAYDNKCAICACILPDGWHADHIIPYSKGGKTELSNGQPLCPSCNLSKSNKMKKELRGWQKDAYLKTTNVLTESHRKSALISAGVGSGKTFFASYFADKHLSESRFTKVLIVSPNTSVKRDWSDTFEEFERFINYDYKTSSSSFSDIRVRNPISNDNIIGISITYHFLANNQEVLYEEVNDKTLIIADEIHHCGDNKSWGDALSLVGEKAGFVLCLTGTPFREDDNRIPFVTYHKDSSDGTYSLVCDYNYTYKDSVVDDICCPVIFRSHEISADKTTMDGGFKVYSSDKKMDRKLIRIARSQQVDQTGVYDLWSKGYGILESIRETHGKNYAGLVVCDDQESAKNLYRFLCDNFGNDFCDLVISNLTDFDTKSINESKKSINIIKNFRREGNKKKWLISVKQVSEGVNIPRIRVIVYASSVKTRLFVTQVMGRGVRNYVKPYINRDDTCYFVYYNNPTLVQIAESIEDEVRHIVEQRTKQEREREEKSNSYKMPEFSTVDNFNINDHSDHYRGQEFDIVDKIKAKEICAKHNVSESVYYSILKEAREEQAAKSPARNQHPLERKEKLRKEIKLITNKMAGKTSGMNKKKYGKDWRLPSSWWVDVNNKANDVIGKRSQDDMTEKELSDKLQLLNRWYNEL